MSPDIGDPVPTDDGRDAPAAVDPDGSIDPAGVPVVAGTFAIFNDGKGGFVVVADHGTGPVRRHIPAAIVKMATGSGLLGRKLGGLLG